MQSYERVSPTTLFNAIFTGVVSILMLIGGILYVVSGIVELWASILAIFGSLVGLSFSAFFFWAYRQDKRFEKEREEDEARVLANTQEDKTPAEANRR